MTNDRDEIFDLTVRYATAIDTRQYQLLAEVFTADAEVDYGEIGQWTSAEQVVQFMEAVHVGAAHTMHRMSNQAIEIIGDTAKARTYIDALILTDNGSGVNAVGYYDDHVVRTDAGWRIARRKFTSVRIGTVAATNG
ncbi:polyketide cyclase [Mycobacterium intermedium]|uniref:Polyketide cyclase n=1 Tax=Mycobacterium intermedium TaxID=28445 RepID=A0A1E3S576_MYCIE|nr:nuclear transport factor 2 family protein [Mycobacterium intermedium]MCV6964148.1 nuclear transport factor 2 family protein [Mycobacterium intermedium]ODQ97333.1 polyketide cyclase [Mycobacterium intermedium]OPE46065.1 polyketide cyclase [Mycobacterium intermedium]ORA93989.1 polyketide cyclase [Mycobacterium intermedium]